MNELRIFDRIVGFCAGVGPWIVVALANEVSLFSPFALNAMFVFGFLGGCAAARLGRGGIRWALAGTLLGCILFLVLPLLPPGDRPVRLGRKSVWLAALATLLVCSGIFWHSTSEGSHWSEAQATDTVAAYDAYLSQWPDGARAEQARERVVTLRARPARLKALFAHLKEEGRDELFIRTVGRQFDDAGTFGPKYFMVYPPGGPDLDWTGILAPDPNLTDVMEEAQTLVFVRTNSYEVGRFVRPGGADAGAATGRTVTICLVDADDTQRRRILEASSSPPERVSRRSRSGGTHTIAGEEREGSRSLSLLLADLVDFVAEESKRHVR